MQKPVITLFCAFTRRWAIDGWLECLEAVDHDPTLVNLCVIIDGDEPYIYHTLKKFAAKHNYRSFYSRINNEHQPNEVKIGMRRARVAEVHNQAKDLIRQCDGEIVLAFEDDTVFSRMETFDRLIQPLLDDPKVGFVEGVQMGRWGANIIGAWSCDDFEFPKKVWTHLPGEGYEEIDGGGWYGYATRRELFLNCDYYTSSSQPWGPDVNYGFWLRQRGYKCLIDWESVFGHDDGGEVGWPDNPPRGNLVKIIYTKENLTGKWDRSDHEQDHY